LHLIKESIFTKAISMTIHLVSIGPVDLYIFMVFHAVDSWIDFNLYFTYFIPLR
jgi:hypothetical protein